METREEIRAGPVLETGDYLRGDWKGGGDDEERGRRGVTVKM